MKFVIVIRHLATISVYSKTFYYQRNRKRKWLKSFLNPMNNKRSNFRFASDVVSEIAKKSSVMKKVFRIPNGNKVKGFFGFQVKWSPIKMLTLS